MDDWRNWFAASFALVVGVLGWLFGRLYHQDIAPGDEVKLPIFFSFIFGKPNSVVTYSIRGIYCQILVVLAALSFAFYNLELITLRRVAQICGAFLFSVPVWELLRYLKKKVR